MSLLPRPVAGGHRPDRAVGLFGGALGVGLGLGLQKIASNYISGFIILLDRSVKLGDQITVDKYTGIVSQIRTRYTVVRGRDGETLVPNEQLVPNRCRTIRSPIPMCAWLTRCRRTTAPIPETVITLLTGLRARPAACCPTRRLA